MVLDDKLGSSNSRLLDQYFIRERHYDLEIYYLSQSYFYSPKIPIRTNSNKKILFNQTLKDIESIHRSVARYDMKYVEFKEVCRKAWGKVKFIFLLIDLQKEIKENTVFVMKTTNKYRMHIPEEVFLY